MYLFLELSIELDRLIPQVGNKSNLPILPSLNHQPDNISDLMLRHPTQPFVGGSGAFTLAMLGFILLLGALIRLPWRRYANGKPDERDRTNTQYITYPCLLVEVLSPGTEAYERGNKFRMYRQNPDLQEYILVDSSLVAIELFRKNNGDNWQIINYQAGDSLAEPLCAGRRFANGTKIELKSINLTFPIEQIYDEIIS